MRESSTSTPSKLIRVAIDKEHYRRIEIEKGVEICHLYPTLSAWVGRQAPDDVNPRSHEDGTLNGSVPKAIEQTIRDNPEDFYLANRGVTILAESVSFDPTKQMFEIVLTDHSGETAQHGVADGGTTDAVIAKVQREVADLHGVAYGGLTIDQIPPFLRNSRVHLEVIVGLSGDDTDGNRLARLVQGRNTSRQVKSWTIADFKGKFDWLKKILDADGSTFKDKIGYEENAAKDVNIMEVLAILTLFHPMYDGKGKAPTVAYSSKGRMDKRLVDEAPGYRVLGPLITDILRLHDHVYANFHAKYQQAFPGGKLARRGKTDDRLFPKSPKVLPLTGHKAQYHVPTGVLYPLLASLRALVRFPKEGELKEATWKIDPLAFFDKYGHELVEYIIDQLEGSSQNNPQTMGKSKTVYIAVRDRVANLLTEHAERAGSGR